MKRTFERIGFMLIGACIMSVGYMAATIDTNVDAREFQDKELGNVIECDKLFVKDYIIVGTNLKNVNADTENIVSINGGSSGVKTSIQIVGRRSPKREKPIEHMVFGILDNKAAILMEDFHGIKTLHTQKP